MIDINAFKRTAVHAVLPDGSRVPVSPFTFRDERAMDIAHPKPRPPLKRAAGGSLAPEKPDYDDPGYIDAFNAWSDEDALLRAAVCIGYETGGAGWAAVRADPARAGDWCGAVLVELGEVISVEWARALNGSVIERDLAGLIAGAGEGNSGAPSRASATGSSQHSSS